MTTVTAEALTPQEIQALKYAADGKPAAIAARYAGVSVRTYKRRLGSAVAKLDANGVANAIAIVSYRRLIHPDGAQTQPIRAQTQPIRR